MNFKSLCVAVLTAISFALPAQAQMMRPPAFMGGVPGKAQFQAMQMQRHQARTLLYREALEELRKNPHAADVPECPLSGAPAGMLCLANPKAAPIAAQGIPPATVVEAPVPAQVHVPTQVMQPVEKAPVAVVESRPAEVVKPPVVRRKLAVLFGINTYNDPIPKLETPVDDVEGIAAILKGRYGYETRVLKNASKAGIVEALNAVAAEVTPEDSVLLFYAGHGYLMDDTNMGYWIPADGSVRTAAAWISNSDISKLLSAIRARQLLLVSDSCFSGSLTNEQKVTSSGSSQVPGVRAVLAFSSGGEEPVSDGGRDGHSIFAWSFIETLKSTKGISPGYEIYRVVHGQVMKEFPQEPQYGAVLSAGHAAGGEYIFDLARP